MNAILAIYSLFLFGEAAMAASTDCDNWNTEEFFIDATIEKVANCLQSGADPNARAKAGATPLHLAATLRANI